MGNEVKGIIHIYSRATCRERFHEGLKAIGDLPPSVYKAQFLFQLHRSHPSSRVTERDTRVVTSAIKSDRCLLRPRLVAVGSLGWSLQADFPDS